MQLFECSIPKPVDQSFILIDFSSTYNMQGSHQPLRLSVLVFKITQKLNLPVQPLTNTLSQLLRTIPFSLRVQIIVHDALC